MEQMPTEPLLHWLERVASPGLLGIQFWDVAAGAPVQDGLRVQVRDELGGVADAVQNHSGVWLFPKLPGISRAQVDAQFALGRSPALLARRFVVSVSDRLQRFHPVAFELDAPVEGGLFDWPHGGPWMVDNSHPVSGFVPLFSRAARSVPNGYVVAHASLWDLEADRPAAWALLEITVPGPNGIESFLGVADALGAVATFMPLPFVAIGSPRLPAWQRSWSVGVHAYYAPQLTALEPRLDAILAQRTVNEAIALVSVSPERRLTKAVLHPLEQLILRTEPHGLEARLESHLIVRPGA